jgi:general secretion pathway protein G
MRARVRKAFTLVEILIVVVILGILAAIVVPQFTNATQDAQGGNVVTQRDTLSNQLELYRARENFYPTLAELNQASVNTPAMTSWGIMIDGGYIKSPAINPINGSSTVVGAFAVGEGWCWIVNAQGVGTLYACEFDNTNNLVLAGQPGQP